MVDIIKEMREAAKAQREAAEAARLAAEAEEEAEAEEGDGESEHSDNDYDDDYDSEFAGWSSDDSSDDWPTQEEEQPQALQRVASIRGTTIEELRVTREERILRAQEMLYIPTALVAILLPKYKWDQDALVQAWYNASDPASILEKQCGLCLEDPQEQEAPNDADCPIGGAEDCVAYWDDPPENNAEHYTMLSCNHAICVPCWRDIITKEIEDNRVLGIRCPMCIAADEPSPAIPESMIKRLVADDVYAKYQRFVLQVSAHPVPRLSSAWMAELCCECSCDTLVSIPGLLIRCGCFSVAPT